MEYPSGRDALTLLAASTPGERSGTGSWRSPVARRRLRRALPCPREPHEAPGRSGSALLIARLKTVVANREESEEGRSFFDEVVAPCCRATEGFVAGWFLTDEAESRTVTFTLWSDESAWLEARRLLSERLEREPDTAARLERINARGVTFESFQIRSAL